MSSKYMSYSVLLLGCFTCVNVAVSGTHQTYHNILRRINPFQRMCLCNRWTQRVHLDRLILEMYPGLFNTQKSLKFMPVVKPVGEKSHNHGTGSYVGNTVTSLNGNGDSNSCCSTNYAYERLNMTKENNRYLRVVHFDHQYQFVPIGRCELASPGHCGRGSCIQMYRHYWMLVWDDELSHFPPVKFTPVEIPSHCECVNVGKS
ncbi:uncharacterized protein LOC125650990 [Ostrea edulis]|uniref:uncharacterized protein LOC125650990 n=1 Tax=Ostrea edulis TaxID=37623 RepID=UPI00209564B3|nr:uncharacterized protein LOC125650990 [Ostrea edulis]XP_048735539.1 uncharacterized protein LOC125650990 [Ostrea edulis]